MRKKILWIGAIAAIILAVIAFLGYRMFYGSAVERTYSVTLNEGESYAVMMGKVKEGMDNHWAFDFYADHIDLDDNIRPGHYEIREGMSVMDIARMLKYGGSSAVRLTINNVRTPEALAAKIAQQINISEEDMLAVLRSPEVWEQMGFNSAEAMFSIFIPNTYEVRYGIGAREVVERLKRESDRFWSSDTRQAQLAELKMTPYEVMTLASIVYEETKVQEEMACIAGVYINRLRRGMLLQADPTVKYAVGDPTLKRILYKHLEVESPYNTYKYKGLPPTPIAMPDMVAIEAVLGYERHDYLYFCARAELDGRHNFAKTLNEHQCNAAAYHKALNKAKK